MLFNVLSSNQVYFKFNVTDHLNDRPTVNMHDFSSVILTEQDNQPRVIVVPEHIVKLGTAYIGILVQGNYFKILSS